MPGTISHPVIHPPRTEVHAERVKETRAFGLVVCRARGRDLDITVDPAGAAGSSKVMTGDTRRAVEHRPEAVPAVAPRVILLPDPLEQLEPELEAPSIRRSTGAGSGIGPVRCTSSEESPPALSGASRGRAALPIDLGPAPATPVAWASPPRVAVVTFSAGNVGVGRGPTGPAIAGSGSACEPVTVTSRCRAGPGQQENARGENKGDHQQSNDLQ